MARTFFSIALAAGLTVLAAGQDIGKLDDNTPATFQRVVSEFLTGRADPGIIAHVADGEFRESIPDTAVLRRMYDKCRFGFMKVLVIEDRGMAVVNVKTMLSDGGTEWHTFVCKSTDARWSIVTWHSNRV